MADKSRFEPNKITVGELLILGLLDIKWLYGNQLGATHLVGYLSLDIQHTLVDYYCSLAQYHSSFYNKLTLTQDCHGVSVGKLSLGCNLQTSHSLFQITHIIFNFIILHPTDIDGTDLHVIPHDVRHTYINMTARFIFHHNS